MVYCAHVNRTLYAVQLRLMTEDSIVFIAVVTEAGKAEARDNMLTTRTTSLVIVKTCRILIRPPDIVCGGLIFYRDSFFLFSSANLRAR